MTRDNYHPKPNYPEHPESQESSWGKPLLNAPTLIPRDPDSREERAFRYFIRDYLAWQRSSKDYDYELLSCVA